jgi:hypothetical protein
MLRASQRWPGDWRICERCEALSDAIQVIAKEQKQTYAACNTLSNTLAEVVKSRVKLEESRSK